MATLLDAGVATAAAVAKGVWTTLSNAAARDTDLDIVFDCNGYDRTGDPEQGVARAVGLAYGSLTVVDFAATGTAIALASGTPVFGNAFSGEATCYVTAQGGLLLKVTTNNWAAWSKIGSMDFTIDSTNEAGEMPMSFDGSVYEVKKLQNQVIVYGSNGIDVMAPSEVYWGLKPLLNVGIMSKNSVTTNGDANHWFIDTKGRLWSFGTKLEQLGYEQLFNTMSDPLLLYDNGEELVYICDGTTGYVYNPALRSMTEGPSTVTGIRFEDEITYVTSSSDIEMPAFTLLTDIVDFETRKEKTIFNLEVSTTMTETLQARVWWKELYGTAFRVTPWATFTDRGIAYLPCYGVEFQFEFQASAFEALVQIDSLKINGVFHGFSYLDSTRIERWS